MFLNENGPGEKWGGGRPPCPPLPAPLNTGIVPNDWNQSKTIPIYKTSCKSDPNNYIQTNLNY